MVWGALLLGAPQTMLRLVPGGGGRGAGGHEGRLPAVTRILGARHLLQGAAQLALGPEAVVAGRAGTAVDAAHGLSMVAAGAFDRRRRTVAWSDVAVAGAFAVSGALLWRGGRR